ncbi:MAG: RNA-binding protein [Nitrososphaerales archaeon]
MNIASVEASLDEIQSSLQLTLERRERILKESRDVILSCSKAIVLLHSGTKKKEARAEIARARDLLESLRKDGVGGLARYLVSPEAEFVEASTVESIVLGRPVADARALGVSNEAYLLGLLDTVGELKRLLLVSITEGRPRKTREYFATIEALYARLAPFAVFDNVLNGVRRKIDVARMITEDTRRIIAEETRRDALLSSIEGLQREMRRRGAGSS